MIYMQDAGSNAVLCKTCSVLLSVLEQRKVDYSSVGFSWLKACPVYMYMYITEVLL